MYVSLQRTWKTKRGKTMSFSMKEDLLTRDEGDEESADH